MEQLHVTPPPFLFYPSRCIAAEHGAELSFPVDINEPCIPFHDTLTFRVDMMRKVPTRHVQCLLLIPSGTCFLLLIFFQVLTACCRLKLNVLREHLCIALNAGY